MFGWRPIQTISTVDRDIPVLSLGDSRQVERVHFVLLSDDERDILAWALEQAEDARRRRQTFLVRQAWHQQWWGRAAILAGVMGAASELIFTIKAAFGH